MKTVADLIKFLELLVNKDMPIQIIYDGYQSHLNIFISANGRLCFSNEKFDSEYNELEVLFHSETEK